MMKKCYSCTRDIPDVGFAYCPECHAKESARVHARDTPDVPEVSLVYGSYQPPPERFRRPSSSGRRVVHKSEPMAG